ncbi:putative lipoprotein [Leptospira interrogans serovar Manilae]|uniref:Lipoprotein n=1 Tax=Leptospira interrogans serovar Manilae TaxID=214675 RepID=A0AAQ1NZE8_LEPIR|nr:hypothetical protein [Leptospira interrogans]AKP25471.1 lipoprotein [Leptospira interrogans serovar Manilae]AKP29256.1 lipoprotein [Leptospira interrogans serovar Manilae]EYU63903.1 hypothetical protein CI00_11205 [Leptospira interrogans serovar Manilae]SOR62176.1 putative lipoprotein [Leptospira interrogans serovar Manilae]
MKIQYLGIIFIFFSCTFDVHTNINKNLFTGDTLVFGGISISLLLLFGLVLKESSQKTSGRSLNEQNEKKTDSAMEIVNVHDTISDLEVGLEKIKAESSDLKNETKTEKNINSEILRTNQTRIDKTWKREVPTHPELIQAHRKFLEKLGSKLNGAEIYFLSGEVSFLLASRKGKVFHIPESPEENILTKKSIEEIAEGRISFSDRSIMIPLGTAQPFGYLQISQNEWSQLESREFQSWKEEYEEQVSIQFESSDPETGFGNLHAFELDKVRVDENILILASIQTDSPYPYVLKWISLWTSKLLHKQVRFYRIRKDRFAFFVSPEEWDFFSKNLNELVESLQKENHLVDLNLGVSILEESREEWSSNARKALGLSIEEGPNRYICL